ncbi:Arsenate reductase [Candidatus Methylacidithermus pantelleriae]|uniref:Arsenate reductase n=2 Tax=Candidatus Methylacidithermus pantelleriae TaxID=2744239 RepID=A0A8J2BKX5_9BACT|nr:Arsenate reductase [Candidatus Methylacidithermus pantelleriae]
MEGKDDGSQKAGLILCTHNSARSQMAEGWLRHLAADKCEVHSAGTVATGVNPLAIRVMAEVGIDISGQHSKTLDRYLSESWDCVITVCDQANETCPHFPGVGKRLHWSIPDPTRTQTTKEKEMEVYRKVRDDIRAHVEELLIKEE